MSYTVLQTEPIISSFLFFLFLLLAASKVLIAPLVLVLVIVLGALALVIGNTLTHVNTHTDEGRQRVTAKCLI